MCQGASSWGTPCQPQSSCLGAAPSLRAQQPGRQHVAQWSREGPRPPCSQSTTGSRWPPMHTWHGTKSAPLSGYTWAQREGLPNCTTHLRAQRRPHLLAPGTLQRPIVRLGWGQHWLTTRCRGSRCTGRRFDTGTSNTGRGSGSSTITVHACSNWRIRRRLDKLQLPHARRTQQLSADAGLEHVTLVPSSPA
jgi:hypothetical protein